MFTNSSQNTPVFKTYAKKYCPKDYNECLVRWEDFVSKQLKTNYLRYNTLNSNFERGKLKYFLEFLLFTGAALLEWSSDLKFHFRKGETMLVF